MLITLPYSIIIFFKHLNWIILLEQQQQQLLFDLFFDVFRCCFTIATVHREKSSASVFSFHFISFHFILFLFFFFFFFFFLRFSDLIWLDLVILVVFVSMATAGLGSLLRQAFGCHHSSTSAFITSSYTHVYISIQLYSCVVSYLYFFSYSLWYFMIKTWKKPNIWSFVHSIPFFCRKFDHFFT